MAATQVDKRIKQYSKIVHYSQLNKQLNKQNK